jgi:hypothetical protein
MRLGKEQAVGYVEDTETDAAVAEEIKTDQSQRLPLTLTPEPVLPVG